MDKEIMDFNAQFNEELKKITIITETSPLGGAKGGADKFYEINCGITAWKFINSDEVFTGKFLLTGKADYQQIKELQEKILPDSIISLKVRQRENAFLLVEIMENKNINEELKNIIKNPRRKQRGIEDFSLKSLRMRGNKSPAPPVLRPRGAGN